MAGLVRWAIGVVMACGVAATGCDSGATTTEGGGGSGGTSGAGGTSGTGGTGGEGGSGGAGGGPVCPDDPAQGPVPAECGIWVRVEGDDDGEGTQAAPVATLARAIELAEQGPGRVYACGETWTEAVVVPSGVSLHGGFDCDAEWAYAGESKRAMVIAPVADALNTIGMMWIDGGSRKQAFLTDFYVESPAAVAPGGSSIGCFLRDELPLRMVRCECVAGDGADGADGAPGDPSGLPAAAGMSGNPGANACSAPMPQGGAAPENICATGISKGGAGGDSSPLVAEDGEPGEPAADVSGEGGLGEQGASVCTAGISGASGKNGEAGIGGDLEGDDGRLTVNGFVGYNGGDAFPGMPGQGGGGGGASLGSATVCGAASSGGAAGGSGGAGGCGGKGSKGGQAGGASLGLATRSDGLFLDDVVMRSGNGGNGGAGGPAQLGGTGGNGSAGGAGSGPLKPGCAGGNGGPGGRGGIGGGGAGGPSIALARLETVAPGNLEIERYFGEGGKGGMGDPGNSNSWGSDGNGYEQNSLRP